MPAVVENTAVLTERTKDPSSTNDTHPYVLAIDQIRVAITRHREYKDSLEDARENSHNIVEESHRSQSPLGFTNDAQTIEDIERILKELDRNHPPPKLSHDSSKIEEDLVSTTDDSGQIVAPLVSLVLYYLSLSLQVLLPFYILSSASWQSIFSHSNNHDTNHAYSLLLKHRGRLGRCQCNGHILRISSLTTTTSIMSLFSKMIL